MPVEKVFVMPKAAQAAQPQTLKRENMMRFVDGGWDAWRAVLGYSNTPAVDAPAESTGDPFDALLKNNRIWSEKMVDQDSQFFTRNVSSQAPEYFWIGCSDSRVPVNQVVGLSPGQVFVQRNVGNQAMHTDMNLMSCLEYAVHALKVKNIVLCGHYNCGAVKGALTMSPANQCMVNCWITDIRESRNQNAHMLKTLPLDKQVARLVEINVLRQTYNVSTSPAVQSAWASGQKMNVYGCVYDLKDGKLHKLVGPINADSDTSYEDGRLVVRDVWSQQLKVADGDNIGGVDEGGMNALSQTLSVINAISEHRAWSAADSAADKH